MAPKDTPGPHAAVALAVLDERVRHVEVNLAALAEEVDEKHVRLRCDLEDGLAGRASSVTVTDLAATLKETRDLALRIWYVAIGLSAAASLGGVGYLVRLLLTGRHL